MARKNFENNKKILSCNICNLNFNNIQTLSTHINSREHRKNENRIKDRNRRSESAESESAEPEQRNSDLKNQIQNNQNNFNRQIYFFEEGKVGTCVMSFNESENIKKIDTQLLEDFKKIIYLRLQERKVAYKFQIICSLNFEKLETDEQDHEHHILLNNKPLTSKKSADEYLVESMNEINRRIEEDELAGSGFTVQYIYELKLLIFPYTSFIGGSYIKLPDRLEKSKSDLIIKMKNLIIFFYII